MLIDPTWNNTANFLGVFLFEDLTGVQIHTQQPARNPNTGQQPGPNTKWTPGGVPLPWETGSPGDCHQEKQVFCQVVPAKGRSVTGILYFGPVAAQQSWASVVRAEERPRFLWRQLRREL